MVLSEKQIPAERQLSEKQLLRAIRTRIEENCKKGQYVNTFNREIQKDMKKNSLELADMTVHDDNLFEAIDSAIEDSIRVRIINQKDQEKAL